MRKLRSIQIIITFLLWAISPGEVSAQTSNIRDILHDFDNKPQTILVTAHRAAHQTHPENSIAAIKDAIQTGADIVEIDVRSTKEGVLVLMHDKTINRMTGDTGLVSDFTLQQLREKRLLFNGKPTDELIPTLKEALEAAHGYIMVDIDFKLDSVSQAMKVFRQIEETQTENQVIFFIYNQYHFIPFLQQANKSIRIMPRAYNKEDVRTILKNYKVPVIHIDDSFYDHKLMKKVRRKKIRIWSNALGKYDKLEKEKQDSGYDELLMMKSINIIQTDDPAGLLKYLRKKGRHR